MESKIDEIICYLRKEKFLNNQLPSRPWLSNKFQVAQPSVALAIYFLKGSKEIICEKRKGCFKN